MKVKMWGFDRRLSRRYRLVTRYWHHIIDHSHTSRINNIHLLLSRKFIGRCKCQRKAKCQGNSHGTLSLHIVRMIKKCSITALLGVLKYRTISVHIFKHYTIWVRLNSISKTTRKNITHSLPRNKISHRNNRTVNEKENIYALGDKCGQTPHTKRSKKKKTFTRFAL